MLPSPKVHETKSVSVLVSVNSTNSGVQPSKGESVKEASGVGSTTTGCITVSMQPFRVEMADSATSYVPCAA